MTRHINIPIFVPHAGCGHDCVFCNQKSISGKTIFRPQDTEMEIERALSTIPKGSDVQIAFFGGSFTGIEPELMIYLLKTAKKYIDNEKVSSVRLSTRPDYIDEKILETLKKYGVLSVELGIQSLDDNVLSAAKRGHSADRAMCAMKLVKDYGFELVGQMMTCLPMSSRQSEIMTARGIASAGADGARIYPTVVLENTQLYNMASSGIYTPPTLDEAVESALGPFKVFISHNIKVLRIGLCSNELLCQGYSGYHPSVGELTQSRYFFDEAKKLLEEGRIKDKNVTFAVSPRSVSKFTGQKKENKKKLIELFGLSALKVVCDMSLEEYAIKLI